MRSHPCLLAGLAAIAVQAATVGAQETATPADEPARSAPGEAPRLADLDSTVDSLTDEDSAPQPQDEAGDAATDPAADEAAREDPVADEAEESESPSSESGQTPAESSEAGESEEGSGAAGQAGTEEAAEAEAAAQPQREASALPPPLGRAELAELGHIAERGRLLIGIARAGIIGTRDMLSRVSDPEGAGIAGWIAEPAGNAMTVTFYDSVEDGPRAVYRASVLGGRVVSRELFLSGDRPALNPVQARMAAARAAAVGLEHRPCGTDQFNYLVVPPAGAETPVTVYQVTPQTDRGRFPLGGHFRTIVAADGSVTEARGFTSACLDVDATPPAEGETARPLAVTHLLDPLPTEVHVLASALLGRPLVVVAGEPQRVFAVTPEGIGEIRE